MRPAKTSGQCVRVTPRRLLEEADLENLRAVQTWFAEIEIDCWPLFATLRPTLEPREVELLRNACETAPRARGSMIIPKFPIVLLEQELSAPWMDDNSLSSGVPRGRREILESRPALGTWAWNPGLLARHWTAGSASGEPTPSWQAKARDGRPLRDVVADV